MADHDSNKDVIILGGGPAGLAAAIALRQRGMNCLVIEARPPVIDKGCGEGLMPDALASLRELGIEITGSDGHLFHGIRFVNSAHQVDARFPNGIGIGVRRTKLHQRIIERAQSLGVEVLWETRVILPDRQQRSNTIEVNGRKISFQWLIGADGQASTLRKWASLDKASKASLRFGFRRHYNVEPWSEYVEVHWGTPGQVYVTPVADDNVCVAFITREAEIVRKDFLEFFPALARRLKGAPAMSLQRGAVSATRRLRRVAEGRVALIGDASGSADAITGEGLAVSFRQAIALAEALQKKNLKHYAKRHKEIGRLPHAMGELMLTMDRWPAMERRAMAALSARPQFFDELLAVHVGAESLSGFALRHGPRLGWQLLQTSSY
ncbi:MAG TPA: NAD(P)/FAD-dependent oxidoreductase [Acidobacteriaceae bacterium]